MVCKIKFRITGPLLIFLMTYAFVQANIGKVHIVLKYQLEQCIEVKYSLKTNFAHLTQCLKKHIYECLQFHKPIGKQYVTQMNAACGVINSGQQLKPYVWNITVHPQFSLSINFLHFHLPLSSFCEQNYLFIKVPELKVQMFPHFHGASGNGLKYCGHRMPRSHSFQKSHATATFYTAWGLAKGYCFVMTFEAFDIMLKSVGFVHRGRALHNMGVYYFITLGRNPDFNFIETEFQISFYATVVQQITLKYPTTPQFSRYPFYENLTDFSYFLSDVRVYDGPGILSPLDVPTCNTSTEYCTCYLSSYQGFMKYRIPSNVWN